MAIKVAFIGAGSIGFTRGLFRDILAVPELRDTRFAFTDISQHNLDMVTQLCQKDLRVNKLPATIQATTDRRRALDGADYVINCTRIGGIEAFKTDIDIPLKYGVDQCVGDTICAGGIMYGQRNIACILDFCKDMRQTSADDVLFLNYANPMAMNTWAALDYGKVNTVGLCHGVEHGHWQIADALGAKSKEEVDVICAGINHQTWFTKILYQGREITANELVEAFEKHKVFSKTEKCRIDVLKRFGAYSTESNGHLSEYLPWYRKRPNEIKRWIDMSSWINGETGGYLRVCTEGRRWFETDFPRWLKAEDKPISAEHRGHERGSYIIESIETGRIFRAHFNVRNRGAITNLPDDCIVEVPGFVDKLGIRIPKVGDLPLACAATCQASVNVQRMAKEAAVNGDVTLLKQAMLHDPLVGAVCNPEEVWQMVDEMLVAQAQWLPQYRANGSIAEAKKRLANSKPLGTNKSQGAARLKVKTVDQLRSGGEKAKAVLNADKAGVGKGKNNGHANGNGKKSRGRKLQTA
ncbi:MAG: alpha-glucosidase/alpha-galactosidase [Planctomycetes bacterium]|nr:alpha-glucosidase/alpha-galactosidase [Planctomycetota bacterium]